MVRIKVQGTKQQIAILTQTARRTGLPVGQANFLLPFSTVIIQPAPTARTTTLFSVPRNTLQTTILRIQTHDQL